MIKSFRQSLIAVALVVIIPNLVQAQWTPVASVGVGPTDECFSFSLHGKGYVGGGSTGRKFYEYDSLLNTWTLKSTTPGNKLRGAGFAFAANGHGYAGCGDTTGGNNPTADLWMYNDTTNTWTQKTNFPGGERDAMLCFVINNIAYVGGGFDAAEEEWNDFYKYDPVTDTWTALPSLPVRLGFPASFVIDNKGYMATGVESAEITSLWQYDPVANAWTPKADFPGAARQTAFGFSQNNYYGYVGGGMAGYDTVFRDMWRYDAAANTWAPVVGLPSLYQAWSCAFTIGNTAFVGTGTYFSGSSLYGIDSFRKYYGAPSPISAGVANPVAENGITLFPNPANDFVTIAGLEPEATVTFTDLTGRELRNFPGNKDNSFYVGDLPLGVYIIKIVRADLLFTAKMLKQ